MDIYDMALLWALYLSALAAPYWTVTALKRITLVAERRVVGVYAAEWLAADTEARAAEHKARTLRLHADQKLARVYDFDEEQP